MFIDAYSHVMPECYRDVLLKIGIRDHYFVPKYLSDMKQRRAFLENLDDVKFVGVPMQLPLNRDLTSDSFLELAGIYNDGMAEMQAANPDLFEAMVATVPIDNIDNALRETERAVEKLGMKGILLPCNYKGEEPSSERIRPLLKMMAKYDLPIWLHPWPGASGRQFVPNGGGWEMLADTADAMLHLACCGIFEEYPNVKFVAHHGGAYIPFFHTRLKSQYFSDLGATGHMYDPNFKEPDHTVPFMYYENLKKFYADTAFYGMCTPQIQACVAYYGPSHLLFGTDFPLPSGNELNLCMQSVLQLDCTDEQIEQISCRNTLDLLNLRA